MILRDEHLRIRNLRKQLSGLFDQERWDEIAAILDREEEKPELWQLVLKSRAIRLGDDEKFTLDAAREALDEALEREPDYVPAMLDMAHHLDVVDGKPEEAVLLFQDAAGVILAQLLDTLRGWTEAKLMDDELQKQILRSYNLFLDGLRSHGLEAGAKARRLDRFDPDELGDEL